MKRHSLFLLLIAFMLIGTSRVMGQNKSAVAPADLKGIWQMCFYVSGVPNTPGELKPSNSFKILSDDGKFTNMTVIPNHGAIIIGLPQLVGSDNILEFEMKGGDVMVLKFFVKTDKDGNDINSWYYETWKRVKMPAAYPKDLVR